MDLEVRAMIALTALYDTTESSSEAWISPDISIEHDDISSSTEPLTLSSWSESLSAMPTLELDIAEAIVDESQRKVWVRSSLYGLPNGGRKESVDVLSFDAEGLLVSLTGEWRAFTEDDDDDEAESESEE